MKKKSTKWIISLVIAVVVIGIGVSANFFLNKEEPTAQAGITTQNTVAQTGNVEVAISGTGNISTINKETLTAGRNATVEEVLVAVGDTVEEGDELITFEDDALDPIIAPFSGEITTLNAEAEMNINMGTELIEVTDYTNLEMIVNVDELDISSVQVGQTAVIDVNALSDKDFTGEVTSVAKEASSSTESSVATYEVHVKITDATDIKVGMTAEATITTDHKENVLTLPIEAVQTEGDTHYVLIPSEDSTTQQASTEEMDSSQNATRQNIEIGLQNTDTVEIISGLSEGDEVLIPTFVSTSEDEQSNMMIRGGMGGQNGGFSGREQMQMPSGGAMPGGGSGMPQRGNNQ